MDTYVLGSVVPLTFECFGADGTLTAPTTAVLTITLPNGTTVTPTLDNPDVGVYVLDYTPAATGRHVAAFVSTGPAAGAAADVFDVVAANAAIVTLADAKAYLASTGPTSFPDDAVTAALDAERAAQADVCRIDDFTPALREALLRRVARNLAARAVPVASFSAFEGGATTTRVPKSDPEIARLEGPYRRLVVG